VAQHKSNNQFLAVAAGALATRHRRRKNIGRMRRVLLPVNVVVIHAADHQAFASDAETGSIFNPCQSRSPARARQSLQHFERDDHVVLLISAQRATHRIEQKPLSLVHGLFESCLYSSPAAQRDIFAVIVSLLLACAVDKNISSMKQRSVTLV
jgi:hypothetical protein